MKVGDFIKNIYINNNELYHYGVLGMKWGVRKFKPGASNDDKSKKRKSDTRIGWDDDVVIKKGTKGYRISKNKSESGNQAYLTVDQNDRNFYKYTWSSTLKAGIYDKNTKLYENTYKIQENLKSPSAAKRVEIGCSLMNRNDIKEAVAIDRVKSSLLSLGYTREDTNNMIRKVSETNAAAWRRNISDGVKAIEKEMKDYDDVQKATLLYSHSGSDPFIQKELGKAVVERGYNMLIDDHGADFPGTRQKVNAPIIVYNVDKALKQIGSKPVKDYNIKRAAISYRSSNSKISGAKAKKYFIPNVVKRGYNEDNYYKTDSFYYPYEYQKKGK